jgi:hypothetical protein
MSLKAGNRFKRPLGAFLAPERVNGGVAFLQTVQAPFRAFAMEALIPPRVRLAVYSLLIRLKSSGMPPRFKFQVSGFSFQVRPNKANRSSALI